MSANEFDIAQLQLRYEQKEQQLNRKIQDLRYELDRLRDANAPAPPAPKGLSERERSSSRKMVIAMAMELYGYIPGTGRSTAAKDIADEIQKRGMRLDEDTIRKYLKEAAEEELPAQQP